MNRESKSGPGPIWRPSAVAVARSHLRSFAELVRAAGGPAAWDGHRLDYDLLHRWSVDHPEAFWPLVWRYCGVIAGERPGPDPWDAAVVGLDRMAPPDPDLGPLWFPGARLNFAENLLRFSDDREALVSWDESGARSRMTYASLTEAVRRVAAALREHGIGPGDRVAGFLPNIPEAVIAMLATASLGAIWSSCSPDFGVKGVIDRFGQIEPRLLFTADGYRYAGKVIDSLERVGAIVSQLASIERVVVVPWLGPEPGLGGVPRAVLWREFMGSGPGAARHESRVTSHESPVTATHSPFPISQSPLPRFPFDHPLFIMYSSGTTGLVCSFRPPRSSPRAAAVHAAAARIRLYTVRARACTGMDISFAAGAATAWPR